MKQAQRVFDFDPKRIAFIAIDLQNWTLGMAAAPRSGEQATLNFVRMAKALRHVGGTIALSRAAFSSGYADMLKAPVDVPLNVPDGPIPEHALAFHPEVAALEADIVVTKRQWSAFYGTELDLQLRRRNIHTLIVSGVMTNFGVEQTAREAWQHNYAVIVAEDACSSLTAEMHTFAVETILPRVSHVRSMAHILSAFERSPHSADRW